MKPLLLLLALMLATAAASSAANAQIAAPPVSDTLAATESSRPATDAIRYRVRVDAPSAIAEAITSAVDLIRWQDFANMTEDLLDRLTRLAVTQAREAAATQGYFSADVKVSVDRTTEPVPITLSVELNKPTRIEDVHLTVTGLAAEDASAGTSAIAKMRSEWRLPRGDVFRQSAWDEAKEHALATLAASPYAAAKIIASEARIDPAVHSAALSLEIESGPPFRFGRTDVLGLERYAPGLVRDFSPIHPGEEYDQEALDDYVRRLLASGYFASVQAAIEPDPAHADDATVTVNVIEAPTKRLELGAGYSTDTRYRASASYSDVNIDDHGLQLHADARIESKVQSAQLRFVRPPAPGGWIDTFASNLARTDIENLVTRTASVTARRRSLNERSTPAFGAGFHASEEAPEGGSRERAHAFFVDGEYTWRKVDDLLAPTRGIMANAQAGVGVPFVSTRGFLRLIGRAAAWWPLGRETQLALRADIGAVIADARDGIPSNFLFRTGGDTTVRGYAFESLGVQRGPAVIGGRYYAVGSAEVTRWINDSLGIAAFVDAGNATDSLARFSPAVGYGAGLRLKTPIGPFRFDVAYGEKTEEVRIHFSVGLSF
ncbi:MAG: BamA/TamA family outer membrane protein [Betaproteobacteria bacterium]|nr:BamA/TamA family outer membrane protein [Betaproteobacteria bacterium]